MRLITEQRQFTRVQVRFPVQWQRVSREEYERWRPLFLQRATQERQQSFLPNLEIPGFLLEGARPIEVAILQSLRQLHQKLDRLLEQLNPRGTALQWSGEAVDLSASGMRFVAQQRVTRDEYLLLAFSLPGDLSPQGRSTDAWRPQSHAIELLARVVNCYPMKANWSIAIAFVAIHPSDQGQIRQFCDKQAGR